MTGFSRQTVILDCIGANAEELPNIVLMRSDDHAGEMPCITLTPGQDAGQNRRGLLSAVK